MTVIAERCIEVLDLLFRHSELIDGGDYKDIGCLFTDATVAFELPDGATSELVACAAVQANCDKNSRRFDDDRAPHTRHAISNPMTPIDEAMDAATCRFYRTVFPRTDELPPQAVGAHRYEDEPRRIDGSWRTKPQRIFGHLAGNEAPQLLLRSSVSEDY